MSKKNETLQEERKAIKERDIETSTLKLKIHQTENDVEQLSEVSKELSHQLGKPEERATAIVEEKQALTRDLIEAENKLHRWKSKRKCLKKKVKVYSKQLTCEIIQLRK